MTDRGFRNHNPGNIRLGPTQWQGMAPTQTDPDFVQFVDDQHGIRAIAETLHTYWDYHGINTIRGAIDRWAPPTENDTAAYIADVAQQVGVSPDDPVALDQCMTALVDAIIKHENGANPYTPDVVAAGIALA